MKRKVALIFIIALVAGGAAWAVDEVQISEVYVDYDEGLLFVHGHNFDNGKVLTVMLGDYADPLVVTSYLPNEIIAELPLDLEDGDYSLTVFTGNGTKKLASYDLTIGASGPQGVEGPQGPEGPMGPQGGPGPPGVQGIQGETGARGEVGAQGEVGSQGETGSPGEPGAEGEPGTQGEPGIPGDPGLQGEQGIQGEVGPRGPEGPPGPAADETPISPVIGVMNISGTPVADIPVLALGFEFGVPGQPLWGFSNLRLTLRYTPEISTLFTTVGEDQTLRRAVDVELSPVTGPPLNLHLVGAVFENIVTYPSRHESDPLLVDVIIASPDWIVYGLQNAFRYTVEGCEPENPVVFVHGFKDRILAPAPGEIPISSFSWATANITYTPQTGDDQYSGGGGSALTETGVSASVEGPFVEEIVCFLHAIATDMVLGEVRIESQSSHYDPITSLIVLDETNFDSLVVQSSPEGEIEYSLILSFSDWFFDTQ